MEPSVILAHFLFLWSVIGEPTWGVYLYRKLEREVAADPRARRRFYLLVIVDEWVWLPFVGFILWLHSASPAAVGITMPAAAGLFGWIFACAVTAAVLVQTVVSIALRERLARDPKTIASLRHILPMLPRTGDEQRWWIALSVTAGICEEILFRGFLFFYFQQIWGQPLWLALVGSSAVFGLAHIYQGLKHGGITGVLGLVMGGLYAATGSVLIPIVLHAIMDGRTLAFMPIIRAADEAGPKAIESPVRETV